MTDSHLLAHGQNRNQYTGSEPNHDDEPIPYYCAYCGNNTAEHDYDFPHPKEPTTPKPQQRRTMEIARHRVELSDAIRALLLTNLLDEDWRLVLESELDAVLERYNKLVMKGVSDATA